MAWGPLGVRLAASRVGGGERRRQLTATGRSCDRVLIAQSLFRPYPHRPSPFLTFLHLPGCTPNSEHDDVETVPNSNVGLAVLTTYKALFFFRPVCSKKCSTFDLVGAVSRDPSPSLSMLVQEQRAGTRARREPFFARPTCPASAPINIDVAGEGSTKTAATAGPGV